MVVVPMDSARLHFEPCVRKGVAQFIKIDESSENIRIVMMFHRPSVLVLSLISYQRNRHKHKSPVKVTLSVLNSGIKMVLGFPSMQVSVSFECLHPQNFRQQWVTSWKALILT